MYIFIDSWSKLLLQNWIFYASELLRCEWKICAQNSEPLQVETHCEVKFDGPDFFCTLVLILPSFFLHCQVVRHTMFCPCFCALPLPASTVCWSGLSVYPSLPSVHFPRMTERFVSEFFSDCAASVPCCSSFRQISIPESVWSWDLSNSCHLTGSMSFTSSFNLSACPYLPVVCLGCRWTWKKCKERWGGSCWRLPLLFSHLPPWDILFIYFIWGSSWWVWLNMTKLTSLPCAVPFYSYYNILRW